jgi:2-dehydropantoate 2-reductase
MGVIDDVNSEIFPDPNTRPNYVQGVITHGVNSPPEKAESDPFFVIHAGHGTIALGIVPREPVKKPEEQSPTPPPPPPVQEQTDKEDSDSDPNNFLTNTESYNPPPPPDDYPLGHLPEHYPQSARYLIRTLTRTPELAAVAHTPHELLQLQLEKLAVNSILNPLTSLIDARNGALLANHELRRTLRLMLAETSLIIRSLPELRNLPNTNMRFSPARLEHLVEQVAFKTKDNVSSMLADVRAGRRTEVGYINWYIVRRGEEVGVKAVVNYAMMCVVQGKRRVVQREGEGEVGVVGRREGINVDL